VGGRPLTVPGPDNLRVIALATEEDQRGELLARRAEADQDAVGSATPRLDRHQPPPGPLEGQCPRNVTSRRRPAARALEPGAPAPRGARWGA